jgi:tRNA(adenine34) deaminase
MSAEAGKQEEPGSSSVDDASAMERAIAEARRATDHGDVPVGALAIIGGSVVAARHNERELTHDPTAHAEILLLRDVALAIGDWRMGQVTVVVTLEPCAMCAGAMVNARVGRLVFGAYDSRAGAVGSLYNLCNDPRLNHELPVTGGVLAERCGALLSSFFEGRRAEGSGA